MKRPSPLSIICAAQARAWFPTVCNGIKGTLKEVANNFPKSSIARKLYHGFSNWYEAGWPVWTNGDFSHLPALVQDARWDQNFVTRREMLRRMRYWSQNSPIVEACLSVGERYTVGTAGLPVSFYPGDDVSADADNSWYDRAEQVVSEWQQSCGWNGESMAELLKIGYRCQKVDGEMFYVKTRKAMPLDLGDRTLQVQKPCLQMVEAHRCESPWNRFEQEGDSLVDGVQFSRSTQTGLAKYNKVGYWMRAGLASFEQNDSWELVDKDDVWHLFNSHRVNQFRGLSDFYSCGITINKLDDLLMIEMKAAATQSSRAVHIENNAGAANPIDPRLDAVAQWRGTKPPANGVGPSPEQRKEMYEKTTGAYLNYLKTGEKVHFDTPTRPSEATVTLFELFINLICAGSKMPRCLVLQKLSGNSARSQGTEVRAELDNADLYFKGDFQKWKAFVREATIWFMEWAVRNDPRVADPPANWRNCLHIHQPEACSVDVGYDTNAKMMMLAGGVMDYDMILGPMGTNFMAVAKRLGRQQAYLKSKGIMVSLPALMAGQIPLNGEKAQPEREAVAA